MKRTSKDFGIVAAVFTALLLGAVAGSAWAGSGISGLDQTNGKPDEGRRLALQRAGIDHHFVAAVASAFHEEFSALFFLIRANSQGDAAALSNALSLFRGQIARTTLTPEAWAFLEKFLHSC